MENRKVQGYREPLMIIAAARGGIRFEMLINTAVRVGDKEGMIGRKTVELNRNQTPDLG